MPHVKISDILNCENKDILVRCAENWPTSCKNQFNYKKNDSGSRKVFMKRDDQRQKDNLVKLGKSIQDQ